MFSLLFVAVRMALVLIAVPILCMESSYKEDVFGHLSAIYPQRYSKESDLDSALNSYGFAVSDSGSEESDDDCDSELSVDPYCRVLLSELNTHDSIDENAQSEAYLFLFKNAPHLVCADDADYKLAKKLWTKRPEDAIKAYVHALKFYGNWAPARKRYEVGKFFKDLSEEVHFDDATRYMLSAKMVEAVASDKRFDGLLGAADLVYEKYHKNSDPLIQGRFKEFLEDISGRIVTNHGDWTDTPHHIAAVLPKFVEFYTQHSAYGYLNKLESHRRWVLFSAAFCCALAQEGVTAPLLAIDKLGLLEGIKPDFKAFLSSAQLSDPRIFIRRHFQKAAWKQDGIALKNLRTLSQLLKNNNFGLFWATEISPWITFGDFLDTADDSFVSTYRESCFADTKKSRMILAKISDLQCKKEYLDLCAKDLDESFADWSNTPEEIARMVPKVVEFYRDYSAEDLLGKLSDKSRYYFIRAALHHAVGKDGTIQPLAISGLDITSKISSSYAGFDNPELLMDSLKRHWNAALWHADKKALSNMRYLASLKNNSAFKDLWTQKVTPWVPFEDVAEGKSIHYVAARNWCGYYKKPLAAAGLIAAVAGYAGYRLTR